MKIIINFSTPWTISYVFCCPDQNVVEFAPGTTESFTAERYKEEFQSKPYSKMDLFLFSVSVAIWQLQQYEK